MRYKSLLITSLLLSAFFLAACSGCGRSHEHATPPASGHDAAPLNQADADAETLEPDAIVPDTTVASVHDTVSSGVHDIAHDATTTDLDAVDANAYCAPLTAGLPHVGEPCDVTGAVRCTAEGMYLHEGYGYPSAIRCMLPNRVTCAASAQGHLVWTLDPCEPLAKACDAYHLPNTCRELPVGAKCCPQVCWGDGGSGVAQMCDVGEKQYCSAYAGMGSIESCQPFHAATASNDPSFTFKTCGAYCEDCLMWHPEPCPTIYNCASVGCTDDGKHTCCMGTPGPCGTAADGTVRCAEDCNEWNAWGGCQP